MVDEKLTTTFAVVPYKIDSIESERIAIDHVAHILPSGEGASGSAVSARARECPATRLSPTVARRRDRSASM